MTAREGGRPTWTARHRINNGLQKLTQRVREENKYQCVCSRRHVCSTSFYMAATFWNPARQSRSIPQTEITQYRPSHIFLRRHFLPATTVRSLHLFSTPRLPFLSSRPLHSTSAAWAVYSRLNSHQACSQAAVECDAAGTYQCTSAYTRIKSRCFCLGSFPADERVWNGIS